MVRVRGSRRAAGLQPSDYDHEITLVDDEGANGEEEEARSLQPVSSDGDVAVLVTANTSTRLLSDNDTEEEGDQQEQQQQEEEDAGEHQGEEAPLRQNGGSENCDEARQAQQQTTSSDSDRQLLHLPESSTGPSIEVQGPSPDTHPQHDQNGQSHRVVPKRRKPRREAVIDILYENERGGFLCGTALFSAAALGGLDPTAWTNAYHKPSPTNIHTAQVPDPSWEWVWPDWRINHQEGLDEGGWEYSFAFSKSFFSWHGPKWWNSFVRRRAWIRKRAKKRPEDVSVDSHLLSTDYFSVRAASVRSRPSPGSVASSRVPSKASMARTSTAEAEYEPPDIEDMEMLLQVLRSARIDREKREAVENYLEHAIDLTELQHEMHEIMSLFVFQASRKQLLSYLMQKHDETTAELDKDKDKPLELRLRKQALDAATKHAEEEVCRLAYWSDVKQMAESGELSTVFGADEEGCAAEAWQGLDKSAPAPPGHGKLPAR